MTTFIQDLRYALRQMRLAPAFTLTAVLTLAIGIGATTAIFTLVHAIMLKSLPVADPGRLYSIGDAKECCVEGWEEDDWSLYSHRLYQRLAAAAPEFAEVAAFQAAPPTYSIRSQSRDHEARPLRAEFVTGNYFNVFGVGALMGRVIAPSDDQQSAPLVAVMSYRTWQQSYGSDPSLIGTTFFINGQPATLIGVAPPGFFGDTLRSHPPDFWMPVQQEVLFNGENSLMKNHFSNWLYAIGRLRPGATTDGLAARLTPVLQQYLRNEDNLPPEMRAQLDPTIPHKYIKLVPAGSGISTMKENYGTSLRILLAVCATVLLIACANIANLLLARGTTRRVQTAVRIAIGASRRRLIRQSLTEAVLLSLVGGLLGLAVSYYGVRVMLAIAFRHASIVPISASPSWPVLGFAFLLSLLTGVVFGVGPAWFASHSDPAEALHGANRSTHEASALPQKILVIGQAALSLVLLACAGLLVTSLRNLEHQDFGFATTNRVMVDLNSPPPTYTTERLNVLYRAIEERLLQMSNVQSVSFALYSPLSFDNWGEYVAVEGKGDPKPTEEMGASWDRVTHNYFSTIGQSIVRGRDFDESDRTGSRSVAIVNQAFVKRFFPNEDPLGRHFGMDASKYAGDYEIVGVVHDAKYNNAEKPANPMFFLPMEQAIHYDEKLMRGMEESSHFAGGMQLRLRGPVTSLESQLRRALAEVDPNLTIISVQTMDEQVAMNFDQERMVAQLAGTFGVIALLLAAIGLYGLTAYTVVRRTSEIGVRMALGADRMNIVRLVLRGAFLQVTIGLLIGIPLAIGAGRLMTAKLFGVRSWDPNVFALAVLALGACAAVASILPARRAASTDPVKALRAD